MIDFCFFPTLSSKMPLSSVSLVKLPSNLPVSEFLSELSSSTSSPALKVAARFNGPIIEPTLLDSTLLCSTKWDLLLFFEGVLSSNSNVSKIIERNKTKGSVIYTVTSGIPSKILNNFFPFSKELNEKPAPKLTLDLSKVKTDSGSAASNSQNLEVSKDLLDFAERLEAMEGGKGPVSMLNFLHFFEGEEAKNEYHKYGQGFAKVGAAHGGRPKLLGLVVPPPKDAEEDSRGRKERAPTDWWNEMSFVHYPSLRHFIDMAADEEYQKVNKKHRLGALRDTLIFCTTEIDLKAFRESKSKL